MDPGSWDSKRDAIDDGTPNPRGNKLAHLSIIFVTLASVIVILRLVSRHYYRAGLKVDDALIVAATFLAIAMTITYNEEAANGFGLHTSQVSSSHQTAAFKYFFAAQIIYKVAACLTKLSIAFLYLRIFPTRKFRIAVFVVVGITIAYTLAAVLVTVFSCNPIEKAWAKSMDGVCLNSRAIWYSTSIMTILTDLMIIALPIFEIRKLHLPTIKKVMLSGLFSLGLFVIACTIIRMISVSPQTTASDQIYYQATSNSWTFVETDVAIMCACLPTLRIPLTKQFRKLLGLHKSSTAIPTSKSGDGFVMVTIGQMESRNKRIKLGDDEATSVENLIDYEMLSKKTGGANA
ncbi:hypothetical protein BX600DRAFT_467390 [Xylariales sp. PMI_506]|nr:hypothetical protein BX600DRAFT_467390 [Xylariales sp. PMI_506]